MEKGTCEGSGSINGTELKWDQSEISLANASLSLTQIHKYVQQSTLLRHQDHKATCCIVNLFHALT